MNAGQLPFQYLGAPCKRARFAGGNLILRHVILVACLRDGSEISGSPPSVTRGPLRPATMSLERSPTEIYLREPSVARPASVTKNQWTLRHGRGDKGISPGGEDIASFRSNGRVGASIFPVNGRRTRRPTAASFWTGVLLSLRAAFRLYTSGALRGLT
jgi:hypothetical protein